MHELGHNLGLHHGGTDDLNNKPVYLSIMNYDFQFSWLPRVDGTERARLLDASIWPLDENALNEHVGFGADAGSATAGFDTIFSCDGQKVLTPMTTPGLGRSTSTATACPTVAWWRPTSTTTPSSTPLTGPEDWPRPGLQERRHRLARRAGTTTDHARDRATRHRAGGRPGDRRRRDPADRARAPHPTGEPFTRIDHRQYTDASAAHDVHGAAQPVCRSHCAAPSAGA